MDRAGNAMHRGAGHRSPPVGGSPSTSSSVMVIEAGWGVWGEPRSPQAEGLRSAAQQARKSSPGLAQDRRSQAQETARGESRRAGRDGAAAAGEAVAGGAGAAAGVAGGARVAPLAPLLLGAPEVRRVAAGAVGVCGERVQPGARHLPMAGRAADPLLLGGARVRLVAGAALELHGRVVREARGQDALGAVAAQAVAARRAQAGIVGEEVVAREAVELLHAARPDEVLPVAAA